MITIKIGKKVRIQKYCLKGIKLYIKVKDKWQVVKFNKYEKELIYYAIKLFTKTNLK